MQPILVYSSRPALYRQLGIALAFGAAGALLWRINSSSTLALLGLCLCFIGISTSIRPLLIRGPRMTIDDKGIVDHMLRYGLIEWSDIEGASLRRKGIVGLFVNTLLCLQLRDTKKYTNRLPSYVRPLVGLNKRVGWTTVTLNLTAVDAEPELILVVIDRELYARRSNSSANVSGGAAGRTTAKP
jgi:hypothetical protein